MNLIEYLTALPRSEWETFAAKAETTVAYLWQLKGGHRVPTPTKCHLYIKASNGAVTLEDLHPGITGKQVA